jgi:glucosamine--fructose-6-phosphate aminotransferase (isomerizing)
MAVAALFQELTGWPARGVPASELLFYPHSAYIEGARTLLVAISRSGETTETLTAVDEFLKAKRGEVLTISNYSETLLANKGIINLVIPAGQEQSIAQTRAFTSLYVGLVAITTLLADRPVLFASMKRLPEAGDKLISSYEPMAKEIGSNLLLDRFYFLGSGPRYGLACEANLKMKEMSLTHSESFHFFEFRHGPKSMVGDTTLVAAFLSQSHQKREEQVVKEMRELGGNTFTLGSRNTDVILPGELPEEINNVLYLPVLQLTSYYRSLSKGLNPDRPTNLDAVVKLAL